MDDFEKAILFSFDETGAVDAALRDRASAYIEQAKALPNIWRLCLERLSTSHYAVVQFWCLQTLEAVILQSYPSFPLEERHILHNALMAVVCSSQGNGDLPQPVGIGAPCQPAEATRAVYVRNKLAQVIVLIVRADYPAAWPSVFLDLLQALASGPAVLDMFCRILSTLNEEVISQEYPRSPEDNATAMRIKDSMRSQCIQQIVEVCYNLIVAYEQAAPDMAALVLETVQRYVSWIDISLVANDCYVPLLFRLLSSPQEPVRLRGAASDCLLAIVSKRMDALAKVTLLQRLQIAEVCGSMAAVKEPELAMRFSTLLTGLATELLECIKKLEGQNGSPPTTDALGALSAAMGLLDQVLPTIFYLMEHADEETSANTFQFLLAYVAKIKRGTQLAPKQVEHLSQILAVIRTRITYDPSLEASLDEPDERGTEEEEQMGEYRRDLFTLMRNISRVAPDVAQAFVQATLAAVLGKGGSPPYGPTFADVEAAIMLLYQLGEGVSEDALKPGGGLLAEVVAALISSTVPFHSHRLVALVYLETVVRYMKLVQQQPQLLPGVLEAFLDVRGIHHPNLNVSMRASYLFMRLVKVLRQQLKLYADTILQSLQDTLASITSPKAALIKGEEPASDDRLYIYEALGLLIGLEEYPPEKQSEYLSALLGPLCRQVDAILASDIAPGDQVGSPAMVHALQQAILAISYLSKGFGAELATANRPGIGAMFKESLEMVLKVLRALPKNSALRVKILSFLHRMVETLGTSIFPFLPSAIQQLLLECEPKDMGEFMQLTNQLMSKFKGGMSPILNEILSAVIMRVFALLPPNGVAANGPVSNTEEVREVRELQKSFINFLQTITVSDLTPVFLTHQNSPHLKDVIGILIEAATNNSDILVRKVCVIVLTKFVVEWCGSGTEPEKVPGFRRFAIESFATDCCIYGAVRRFDLADANTMALFTEIVAALKTVYERCGDELLMHLATVALPAVHCPPNLAEQFCFHLQHSDIKALKLFMKQLVDRLQPLQNGNHSPLLH